MTDELRTPRRPGAVVAVVLVAAAVAGAAGWIVGRRTTPAGAAPGGAAGARFDGRTLTLAELEREIAAQPAPIREQLAKVLYR